MKKYSPIRYLLFAISLTLAFSFTGSNGNTTASGLSLNHSALQTTCEAICFRSPQYYLLNPKAIIRTPVLIAGENYNNPTLDPAAIYFALKGPGIFSASNPTKLLNQEFTAAQLSLANAGGDGSPSAFTALTGKLSCYGLPVTTVTLSNGVILTSNSTLGDLFAETRDAIIEKRTVDFIPLKEVLGGLYSPVALSYCPSPK